MSLPQKYTALRVAGKLAYVPAKSSRRVIGSDQARIKHRKLVLRQQTQNLTNILASSERLERYLSRCHRLALAEDDARNGSPIALLGEYQAPRAQRIGPWFVVHERTEEKDWNRYSKSWHNSHGPAITVSNTATAARMLRGKPVKIRLDTPETGDWQYRVLASAGAIRPVKSKYPLSIRLKNGCLNPFFFRALF